MGMPGERGEGKVGEEKGNEGEGGVVEDEWMEVEEMAHGQAWIRRRGMRKRSG